MKDLKIYYLDEKTINPEFDKKIETLAKEQGLTFQGSGFEIDTGIRDIHYKKEKK